MIKNNKTPRGAHAFFPMARASLPGDSLLSKFWFSRHAVHLERRVEVISAEGYLLQCSRHLFTCAIQISYHSCSAPAFSDRPGPLILLLLLLPTCICYIQIFIQCETSFILCIVKADWRHDVIERGSSNLSGLRDVKENGTPHQCGD